MTSIDIEIGLSDEECAIRDTTHKFAEEVLRPVGAQLDRMPDPADVIGAESPLWPVFEKYHQLGLGALAGDTEMDPIAKARLMAIVNEELSWGDVGLAITLGLCGFHGPWVQQTGDAGLIERFCNPEQPTILRGGIRE